MEDEKTENLVVEDTTENVGEQATEEVVEGEKTTTEPIVEEEKKYTEAELDEILARKKRNMERKLRREYEQMICKKLLNN